MKSQWKVAAFALSLCALGAHARLEFDPDGARPRSDVVVQLQPESSYIGARDDVIVNVTFANIDRKAVALTRWFVPIDDFDEPLFEVTKNGVAVEYMGPIVKRGAPQPDELIVLKPGETLTVPVELSGTYDFSAGGEYSIRYRTQSAHLSGAHGGVASLVSPSITVSVEPRAYSNVHALAGDGHKAAGASSVSFTGRCSSAQQATLLEAVNAATAMAGESNTYLGKDGGSNGTPRYTTWFGAYSATGWDTANQHFSAIADAFNTKPLTLDCSCKKRYYAYVYSNQPYKIYVCRVFWDAPLTGTDSKGGTLIHEMSHFDVVAGTNDWAYGQAAAKDLASSDPVKALNNADNHEYFAENTPTLR